MWPLKLVNRLARFAEDGAICQRTGGHIWAPLSVSPPATWPADAPVEDQVTTSECIYCGSTVGIGSLQQCSPAVPRDPWGTKRGAGRSDKVGYRV